MDAEDAGRPSDPVVAPSAGPPTNGWNGRGRPIRNGSTGSRFGLTRFLVTEQKLSSELKAGTFLLRRNMTPQQLVEGLLNAPVTTVVVQLREGLRLGQVTTKLETLPLEMNVADFYKEATSPPQALLSDYPWLKLPQGASLEGFLAPATYTVAPDVTPDALIRMMLDAFYRQIGPDRMTVPKARGMTFYQVLTLASLVEKEAVIDAER